MNCRPQMQRMSRLPNPARPEVEARDTSELQDRVKNCSRDETPIGRQALTHLNRVLSHVAEDMTVRVESGICLDDLQKELQRAGQWLPIDPCPADLTLKEIVDHNLSGPRRFGCGSIREHIIGMEMLLADGRLITSGGNVVKNVAGYDLQKLFIGAEQSLGIVTAVTFKLQPLPKRESFVKAPCKNAQAAATLTARLLDSPACPVVVDWVRLEAGKSVDLVIGFAGNEQDVAWQLDLVEKLGIRTPADLEYARQFSAGEKLKRQSVLPSRLGEFIESIGHVSFLARAGNGLVYSEHLAPIPNKERSITLENRLKADLDPAGLLPPLPA
jgi:FAD/FMN-containing dehydrogenase